MEFLNVHSTSTTSNKPSPYLLHRDNRNCVIRHQNQILSSVLLTDEPNILSGSTMHLDGWLVWSHLTTAGMEFFWQLYFSVVQYSEHVLQNCSDQTNHNILSFLKQNKWHPCIIFELVSLLEMCLYLCVFWEKK